jgi:spermidine/putrescine transport system substrate-binding protein
MLAKLEAGATGYDLLVPTGNAVETLIRKRGAAPARQGACRT